MSNNSVQGDLSPGSFIVIEWSWGLITTSYLISVLGSYTYFQILSQLALSKGRLVKQLYLALSSLSLGGCAVWSMHFIGMMACNFVGTPVSFDVGLTILSGLVAVISCRICLMFLTTKFPPWLVEYIGGDQDHPLLINLPTPNHNLNNNNNNYDYNDDPENEIGLNQSYSGLKVGLSSSPIYFNRNFLVKPYFKDNSNFHLEREPSTPEISPPDSPYDSESKPLFYNQSFLNPQTNTTTTTTSTSSTTTANINIPSNSNSTHNHHHHHHHLHHNNNRSTPNTAASSINSEQNIYCINNDHPSYLSSSVSSSNSSNSSIYKNDTFVNSHSPKSQSIGFELENLENPLDFSSSDFLSHSGTIPKKKKSFWMKFKKYIFHNGFMSSNIWYNNRNTFFRLTAGSFLLAIGIFGMHYTGMMAMRMNASSHYIGWIVFLSFIIAWLASFAALYITAFSNTHLQHILSAIIMGLGVCGMHYTGMKSVDYYYEDMGYTNNDNNFYLALNISLMSLIVCFFCIVLTSIVNKRVRDKLSKLTNELKMEKLKSDILINSILPSAISNKMKQGEIYVAEECSGITIIFADIVNFTKMTNNYSPKNLVLMLNRLYSLFDDLSETMKLEKIKTIGDSYMVVCGLPWHMDCDDTNTISPDLTFEGSNLVDQKVSYNANKAIMFANNLLDLVEKVNQKYGYDIHLRIGINTGDAIAGVIGKKRFSFDLWGDAVNVASRMESSGIPDKICVSENTFNLLSKKYVFEKQSITVKGKGDMGLYILNRDNLKNGHSDIFEPFNDNSQQQVVIPTIRDTNYIEEFTPSTSYVKRGNPHISNHFHSSSFINNEGGRGNS
ncbi:hypothetical protein PPL_00592 [Heterostelium album PN500]|uniref:Uncharacterized protein n=1 Tax=Heterostelium pallidum (strain ATCC 26659 / Pp 5 / PN500) TaxID=670386 RepID=D3AWW4_HETP5|nr:hypothetical protein PPL_00592 [Heterostelium album PN500]EFA86787.1 hypothetical protein PPL_00592 [Heterostelium album PN500]|eukprot:XP_020438891.1 hypothetical protein PPL_00592 [Heterostelium album PN500]